MSYQARPSQRFSLGTNLCSGGLLVLMLLVLGGTFGNIHRPAAHPTTLVPQSPADTSSFIDRTSIVSDFDGDGQPDLATSRPEGSHYKIDIRLSAQHQNVSFTVPSREPGIGLIAWDVDGDQDYDLIIVSPSSLQPLGVWLNDGHGHFEKDTTQPCSGPFGSALSSVPVYKHNHATGSGTALSQSPRFPFDRSAWGIVLTNLEPQDWTANDLEEPSLPIQAYNLQSRSPPLSMAL